MQSIDVPIYSAFKAVNLKGYEMNCKNVETPKVRWVKPSDGPELPPLPALPPLEIPELEPLELPELEPLELPELEEIELPTLEELSR